MTTSQNWFKHIRREIIARGKDYYLSDRVQNLEYEDGIYTAEVDGTDLYNVEVEIDGDKLINSDCDCPYDRGICKHVAAVLFAIENGDENITESEDLTFSNATEIKKNNIRKYVFDSLERLDKNQLIAFIKEFIQPTSSDILFKMESFIKKTLNEEIF